MAPNYNPDDFVVSFGRRNKQYRINDVVVVEHPVYGRIIKRVVGIDSGKLLLAGDNPASTSSNQLGWLTKDQVIGKVIWHIEAS